MNTYIPISFIAIAIFLNSCTSGQTASTNKIILSASEFSDKIRELPSAPIIDVRTPDEFSTGHLINARNYDWNGNEFEQQISTLDKQNPVFVYCLSGGRSSLAANKMRQEGFKQVYEMDGGIMKWRTAKLPETAQKESGTKGLTKSEFDMLLNSDKLVLVDFYADWCAPCKKMKPYLDEISNEMSDKVMIIRINADENRSLCEELMIDVLPVLQLYKNKELTWTNKGFIDKEGILKQLH